MGICQAFLSYLVNPLTYLVGGGGILGLALLYSYSSYSFLPSLMILSRFSSLVNFIFQVATKIWEYGFVKIFALYTTFSTTINSGLEKGLSPRLLLVFGEEFWSKLVLSFKNIVDGLGLFSEWVRTALSSQSVCSVTNNTSMLLEALFLVWTGVAAYILIIWLWDLSFYDWRNEQMEQQQVILLVVAVTALSLAAHSTGLFMDAVLNGKDLVQAVSNMSS